jgi:predicted RNA-binding protein with PUA-like domain
MRAGDRVLFYHSVEGQAVVGIAEVAREAYPDPTTKDERWVAVDLVPVKGLARPVTLDAIKKTPALKDIPLLRQSRLSVMPLTKDAFETLVAMA